MFYLSPSIDEAAERARNHHQGLPGAQRLLTEPTPRSGRLLHALLAYTAIYVAWVAFGWGGEAARVPIADLGFLPITFGAIVLALRASRREPRLRRPWRLVAAALGSMLVGDAAWCYLELVAHREPFPSIADPFYLAFYPLLMAGLIAMPVARRQRGDALKFWLDSLSVVIGGAMLMWYFVLLPMMDGSGEGLSSTLLSLAYPVGDLVLIFGATAVLLRKPDRAVRAALQTLVAAATLFVAADLAFGALSLRDAYRSGDWPDALWMLALALFAVAAHQQSARRPRMPETVPGTPRAFSVLPYLSIVAAYGLLFAVTKPVAMSMSGGLLLGAIALTAIVVSRQVIVMADNERLMRKLERLVRTDDLTGLFTRRAFMELAEREWARMQRYQRPLCAVAIDVDRFKEINDTYGHRTGDDVLSAVARRCRLSLRVTDVLGRMGGDEFVAVLPDTTLAAADALVQRLRGLMSLPVETPHGIVEVTVSIGVSSAETSGSLEDMLERADAALYRAKQEGRDCVRTLVAG